MKLVNANLRSIGEAADKMVAGEVFYSTQGDTIYHKSSSFYVSNVRLLSWSYFKEWRMKKYTPGKLILVKKIQYYVSSLPALIRIKVPDLFSMMGIII